MTEMTYTTGRNFTKLVKPTIYYTGYVSATAHYSNTLGAVCLPSTTRDVQIFDIVHDYVRSHPAKRTDDASILIVNALQEAYPCKK